MNTYRLGNGAKLRTAAVRRFLIVGQYQSAKPAVEASTDDENAAARLIARYRRDFPFTVWTLLDQSGRGGD